MNMRKIAALLLALCMMLVLCACGGEEPAVDTPAPETTEVPAPETTEALEETEAAPAEPTYTVKLTDEGGNPISGVMVQICLESCMPALTGEDGMAAFYVTAEDGYYATVTAMPEGYDYATEEQKFYFEDRDEVTIVLKALA